MRSLLLLLKKEGAYGSCPARGGRAAAWHGLQAPCPRPASAIPGSLEVRVLSPEVRHILPEVGPGDLMLNQQPAFRGLSRVLRKDMFKPEPPGPVNGTLSGDTVLAHVPQHPTLGQGGP